MATFKSKSRHLDPLILTNPIVYRAVVSNSILFCVVGIKGVRVIVFQRGMIEHVPRAEARGLSSQVELSVSTSSRAKARDTGRVTEGWWFEGVMISGHGLATRVLKHAAHDER